MKMIAGALLMCAATGVLIAGMIARAVDDRLILVAVVVGGFEGLIGFGLLCWGFDDDRQQLLDDQSQRDTSEAED